MKIAMVCTEANPLIKTGGLADATHALARSLNKDGNETTIILPYYKIIKENKSLKVKFLDSFDVFMSWRTQYAGIYKTVVDGVTYYLIDNEFYFNFDKIYGFENDGERFAFFSIASLVLLKHIEYKPDVIHVHDWQVGMVPCLLKERFQKVEWYRGIKTVLTIHNPAYKGMLDKYYLNNFYGLDDNIFDNGNVRFDGMLSTLKAGIHYADMVTTVSPTHREELLAYSTSQGLNYVLELRKEDFVGIVNGVDDKEYNPEKDPNIVANYNVKAFAKARNQNRKDLLEAFHMPETKGPIFGIVSRLTWQKGIELIWPNIEHIVGNGATLIVVGNGEKELEEKFQQIRDRYPNNVGIYIGYNNVLAHKVYAGSDFFLMPSLFEPCGISHIIAERYGSLPVVRETGGLKDTVVGFTGANIKVATGFTFLKYDGLFLGKTFDQVFEVYKDKEKMKKLIKNTMSQEWSWDAAAKKYEDVYRKAMAK